MLTQEVLQSVWSMTVLVVICGKLRLLTQSQDVRTPQESVQSRLEVCAATIGKIRLLIHWSGRALAFLVQHWMIRCIIIPYWTTGGRHWTIHYIVALLWMILFTGITSTGITSTGIFFTGILFTGILFTGAPIHCMLMLSWTGAHMWLTLSTEILCTGGHS